MKQNSHKKPRYSKTIALILFVIFSLSACDYTLISESSAVANTNEPNSTFSRPAEETPVKPSDFTPVGELHFLEIRENAQLNGFPSDQGFYRFVPRADGSANLLYTDFASLQEVYLCNQPNCTHSNDSCSSWFPTHAGTHLAVPFEDTLVIVHNGIQGYTDAWAKEMLPAIDVATLSGADRKRAVSFPANFQIPSQSSFAKDDKYLYFTVAEYQSDATFLYLYALDVTTQEVHRLNQLEGANEKIVGVDGTDLIMSSQAENVDVKMLNYTDVQVTRYHLSSGEDEPIFTHSFLDVGGCIDGKYYLLGKDNTLKVYDLYNGNCISNTPVNLPSAFENLQIGTNYDGIFDNHIVIHTWETVGDEPSKLLYYAVPVDTGIAIELKHRFDDTQGTPLPKLIVSQVGQSFLIDNEIETITAGFPIPDGGTIEVEYNIKHFSLMEKETYWDNGSNQESIRMLN